MSKDKKYIICDSEGEIVRIGSCHNVYALLKINKAKLKELVETGEAYNGYTVDEYITDEYIGEKDGQQN